ncbi:T9SS type A sorting domain-containing protein [Flavobacterium crassostreae]|uniref:DUF8202 domain-containing protein n=1 Tax=Flavobacterium crassostreae TaxID=1763534 RepID=A0A1B9DT47_9FLAO|nr:T9SS type A sorting domain-containing protein [Flavobacterium crassostreae]OCB72867.1 hypothetical protein LPBF_11325 [Flavobacterium crassostreae]
MNTKTFAPVVLLIMLTGNLLFAQQKVYPGNVLTPYFWITSKNVADAYHWDSRTKDHTPISDQQHPGAAFNFNPSIYFNAAQDSLSIPLGSSAKRQQTLFLVYKVKDSLTEQFLWTINQPQRTLSVATNKRLVDLKKYTYQSYSEKIKPNKANIHFFQQNITDSIAKPAVLSIGQKSKFISLPPQQFDGNISEIVVYNRVLSGFESQKIASYLAIKYGISLSQFETKNYLNSSGNIIWDSAKHQGFASSITALGRDDASGLLQSKSSNMAQEGLLTLTLKSKSNTIPNQYFVFWSDNAKSMQLKKQEQGQPIGIARQWQLDFTNPKDLSLDWSLNPNFIKGNFPKDTYYWLYIDYSGKGTYTEEDSEYLKLASTSSKEKLVLHDFDWDKQKTGKAKFTIKIAPKMFSRVWITQADCGVKDSGKLNYSIQGGEAPFTITLQKEGSDVVVKQWKQDSKNTQDLLLSSGSYTYIVRDAKANVYSETIFVADKQGTLSNLKATYQLTDGKPIILDASQGLQGTTYAYQWYYEGDFIDNTPKILLDQAGDYELRLSNSQGCTTSQKILVTTDSKEASVANVLMLYPNPTPDGRFTLAMQFAQKTDVTLTIHTLSGGLVQQKQFSQIENYVYDGMISAASGMYLVSVRSDFGTKNFKVIVK